MVVKERRYKILLVFGLALCIFPISVQLKVDIQMSDNEVVWFSDAFGNRIFNKYYPGTLDFGVMIFHGMGNDQNSLDLFTTKFQRLGYHVFATDFSGHGRSSGVIPSGSNSDNILANQVLRAQTEFKVASGLQDSSIMMVGHSMGARAIVRAATIDTTPVNGCILIGSAIHVANQSIDSWTNDLGPDNPDMNILIITGAWDDVCPPDQALSIYQKLSNDTTLTEPMNAGIFMPNGNAKTLRIFSSMTHTHEIMSVRVAEYLVRWVEDIRNPIFITIIRTYISFEDFRVWFSLVEITGIMLMLVFGQKIIKLKQDNQKQKNASKSKELAPETESNYINMKKFLLYKLLIWLGAIGFAVVIGLLIAILPVAMPYFMLIFVSPIAGYGIMLIILYRFGRVPGHTGKWLPKVRDSVKNINWWSILFGVLVAAIITTVISYLFSGFLYHIFPMNIRIVWLLAFTLIGTIGFYVQQKETIEIRKAFPTKPKFTMLNNLIFLIPFIAGVLVILISGMIIYLPDAIHDLTLVIAIVLIGNLLNQIWKKPLLTAVVQSFIMFFILVPRGQMTYLF